VSHRKEATRNDDCNSQALRLPSPGCARTAPVRQHLVRPGHSREGLDHLADQRDRGDFVCQPAPIGIVTGTETVLGEFIPTSQGFHFHLTSTQDYRIYFADGSYLVSSSPTHQSFNSTGRGEVNTEVQQDRGSLYSASGQLIGIVSVFSVSHTTWIDANGNGFPDPGSSLRT
jgi:hypothetical protein